MVCLVVVVGLWLYSFAPALGNFLGLANGRLFDSQYTATGGVVLDSPGDSSQFLGGVVIDEPPSGASRADVRSTSATPGGEECYVEGYENGELLRFEYMCP